MSAAILDLLQQLGSCGVSDVLDAAGAPRRLLPDLRPVTVAQPVAGRALTVQLAPMAPGEGRPDRHLCATAVDAGSDEDIVVVAVDGDAAVSGAWGGLLSLAAHTRGLRGTVVAGLCRDTDEIRALGYPVYAHATTPTTARGRLKEVATGVDVTVHGVAVRTGDYVVADSDGVVVVPAEEIAAVVESGRAMLEAEAGFMRRIRAGEQLTAVLGGAYESLTVGEGDADG